MPGYHLPLFAAEATGIWQEHGLDVELVDPFPGPDNAKAVAAGRYDACLTSAAHFLRAKREDPALAAKFVFMVARRTHIAAFAIEGRPAAHGRPIAAIADLAGASFIGEPQSPFVREYLAFLALGGIEPGRGVALPYEDQFAAVARGEGDVAIDFLDLRPRFEEALRPDQRLRPPPFFEGGVSGYGSGLVVSTWLIETRRDAVRRLGGALRGGLLVTREDPAVGLDQLCRRYPATDRERALRGWSAGAPLVFVGELGAMDRETWQETLEHYARVHGGPPLDPDEVFDGSFVSDRAEAASAAAASR